MPSGHIPDDLTGRRFGKWIMLYRHEPQIPSIPGRATPWRCRCDCGHEQDLIPGPLKRGIDPKCIACQSEKLRLKKIKKSYNEMMTRIQSDIVPGRHRAAIRKNAEVRSIFFDERIDVSFLSDLFRKQNGKCVLSGLDLKFNNRSSCGGTASLDRIRSDEGYTMDNIQWVHKRINVMKGDQSDDDFIAMCRVVVAHQNEKGKG